MTNLNEIMPKKYQIKSRNTVLYESDDRSQAMTRFMNMRDLGKIDLLEGNNVIASKGGIQSTETSNTQPVNS